MLILIRFAFLNVNVMMAMFGSIILNLTMILAIMMAKGAKPVNAFWNRNIAALQTVQHARKTLGTPTAVALVITITVVMAMIVFYPIAVLWVVLQCAFVMMVTLWTTKALADPILKSVDHVTAAKMKYGQLNGVMMMPVAVQVASLISPPHGHFVLW
jgi:Ca2+/Na+ antiporter